MAEHHKEKQQLAEDFAQLLLRCSSMNSTEVYSQQQSIHTLIV